MGTELWIYGLGVLVATLTLGILVAGLLLLRAMAGVRRWNLYLGAVAATLMALLWAAFEMNLRWELAGMQWADGIPLSDEATLQISPYLMASFYCVLGVFIGGLLLYFLGRTAAQERKVQRAAV
ncbi:hypothetical protein ACX80D_03260 [Arthrobacter sp. Sr24]